MPKKSIFFGDSSCSDSEQENFPNTKESEYICDGSNIDVKTFNKLFLGVVGRLSMSAQHADIMLEFIRVLFPLDNNVPNSFYMINNSILTPNVTESILCKLCKNEVTFQKGRKKLCSNELCQASDKYLKSSDLIKVFNSNVETQIISILDDHYQAIIDYQSKIRNI